MEELIGNNESKKEFFFYFKILDDSILEFSHIIGNNKITISNNSNILEKIIGYEKTSKKPIFVLESYNTPIKNMQHIINRKTLINKKIDLNVYYPFYGKIENNLIKVNLENTKEYSIHEDIYFFYINKNEHDESNINITESINDFLINVYSSDIIKILCKNNCVALLLKRGSLFYNKGKLYQLVEKDIYHIDLVELLDLSDVSDFNDKIELIRLFLS